MLQGRIELNAVSAQNFKQDLASIKSFNSELLSISTALEQKKDSLLGALNSGEIKSYYQQQYSLLDVLLQLSSELALSLEMVVKDGKRTFKEGSKLNEVAVKIIDEKVELDSLIQPYLQDELVKKAIDELNESIANDKKALLDIVNLGKKIEDKKKALDDAKAEMFRIYEVNHKEYTEIVDDLKSRTVELEKDGLKIEGKSRFNFAKLRREIINVSDGRSASYNGYGILSETNKATDEVDFDFIMREVRVLFEAIVTKSYKLTNKTNMSNAVKVVLNDYFFDYWKINYKNDQLGEMSTGKASFVILMLIIGLSKSKAPILIDQPEDNLDNRSITTDLVNYLRNKKLERQIIIVTHNANIVVNADAENVIVANQKGQNDDDSTSVFKFDYVNGAIENSFDRLPSQTDVLKSMGIRQHIADIVEGGKEAFIMREKKYRFH